jgi:hypothetical protein
MRALGGPCAKICRVPGPPHAGELSGPDLWAREPAQPRSAATPETMPVEHEKRGSGALSSRMPRRLGEELVEVQAEALLPAELAVRVPRAAAVARGERAFCPAPSARAMDDDLGHRAVADFLVKTPHQGAGK